MRDEYAQRMLMRSGRSRLQHPHWNGSRDGRGQAAPSAAPTVDSDGWGGIGHGGRRDRCAARPVQPATEAPPQSNKLDSP